MFIGLRNKKGSALITVFLVITVLLVLSAAFVSVAISHSRATERFKNRTVAFQTAEAGLDHAFAWLQYRPVPPAGILVNPWEAAGAPTLIGGGNYTVIITKLVSPTGDSSIIRYSLTSSGSFAGATRVLTSYVQTSSFARYIWFTNGETYNGTAVWFWSLDYLDGLVHTNGHFNIYKNPVFAGAVSSADDYIRYYNNGNNINLSQTSNPPHDLPNFQQGINLGAYPIVMPNKATKLRNAAACGGLTLTGNTTVVLKDDGTMDVTNADNNWNNTNRPLPDNGALFVTGGNLTIEGTLSGQLTAGAENDIIISDNIVYADDPRANAASTDVMGIVSEGDVVIDDSASGPGGNLEINACVMALNDSFMLESYWIGPAQGTLTVYGGIIQEERGPIGTFNAKANTQISGYAKNYTYDLRLLGFPPPFMPTTGDYDILAWEDNNKL
ncbi:MAG: DUF4900 domain-containing protein [Candidatus Omnitrophota bacterium]